MKLSAKKTDDPSEVLLDVERWAWLRACVARRLHQRAIVLLAGLAGASLEVLSQHRGGPAAGHIRCLRAKQMAPSVRGCAEWRVVARRSFILAP